MKMKMTTGMLLTLLMIVSMSWAEPIRIGAVFPQTGFAAQDNIRTLNGVRLAVEELNMKNGLLGRPVELIIIDTRSTIIGAKIAADRAVESGVCGIIGPSWSSDSLAAAKVAQGNGVPMIATLATHPAVTKTGNFIFRVCFNDNFQGKVLARFAREELGAETAVVMMDVSSDYSMGLAAVFSQHFEAMRGKTLLSLKYKHSDEDYTDMIKKAAGASPDVFFIPAHMEIRTIVQQAVALGVSQTCVGGDGWYRPEFVFPDNTFLKRGYYTTHWAKESDIAVSQAFVKQHPSPEYEQGGTLSYDAVMLLADAISRAGSAKPADIRDALAKTVNFQGVTGTITMDENGDPIKNAFIIQIENGMKSYYKTIMP